MDKQKVAIVGAGFAGVAAIKSCLEEGLEPVCFEQNDNIGGIWYYTEEYRQGQGASAFENMTSNNSKEMFVFSDFPYPTESPPYLTCAAVCDYLKSYCDKFGLNKHIHLKTNVKKIRKSRDYDVTGKWEVETEDLRKFTKSGIYDSVMICSGFYKKSIIPDVKKGMDTFKGSIEYAQTFRNGAKYKNQRVVVVGNGNSSGDMAAAAAEHADQVYYSVGKGMWMIPRYGQRGVPSDYIFFKRANFWNMTKMNNLIANLANSRLDLSHAGLCPSTVPTESRIMVNDEIPIKIMNGKVKVVGRLVRLGPHEAEFEDGTTIEHINAVLFATGYDVSLEFLDEKIKGDRNEFRMYKMTFPINLLHNTLALVGCMEVIGPFPPTLELQARLAARVFAGRHQLPSKKVMSEDVNRWNKMVFDLFGRYKYLMPVFPFWDELAAELGVAPSWWDLIKAGPRLAYLYYYGTAFPYYYRLWGPHPWSGAKKAISDALDHGYYAIQPRHAPAPTIAREGHLGTLLLLGTVAVMMAVFMKYFSI